MSEPQSEPKSETQKETSPKKPWIEKENINKILIIGCLLVISIPMIILAAKGDNQLCFFSTCYGTSSSVNLANEAFYLAAAGGAIFLVTSLLEIPLIAAFGIGAIVFLLAHKIHF